MSYRPKIKTTTDGSVKDLPLDAETVKGVDIIENGKIKIGVLPATAITDTFVVNSQSAMLALSAQKGDVCVRIDLNKSMILKQEPASTLANWQELLTPADKVQSVNGKTGTVTISASDLGAITNVKAASGAYINSVGTPSVTVNTSGTTSTFTFNYLKGAKGDPGTNGTNGTNGVTPKVTAAAGNNINSVGTPTVTSSTSGDTTTFTFNYLKGAKGDPGTNGTNGTNGVTPTIKVAAGSNINSVGTPKVTASTSGTTTTFTFDYLKGATGAAASLSNAIEKYADVDNRSIVLPMNTDFILFSNYDGYASLTLYVFNDEGDSEYDSSIEITKGITMIKYLNWGVYITLLSPRGNDFRIWQGDLDRVVLTSRTSKVSVYKIN